jgi:hypothetical protein
LWECQTKDPQKLDKAVMKFLTFVSDSKIKGEVALGGSIQQVSHNLGDLAG